MQLKMSYVADVLKTVPSVYTQHYLSIPQYIGRWKNRFQETQGSLVSTYLQVLFVRGLNLSILFHRILFKYVPQFSTVLKFSLDSSFQSLFLILIKVLKYKISESCIV